MCDIFVLSFGSSFTRFPFQTQSDKEKLLYELDDLQAQVEKAQLSTNRSQAEREDFQLEAERQRDKNDKLQVRTACAERRAH